jgi:hypothetical protein
MIHGMMVIPGDPKLQIVEAKGGSWFNFTATTQGRRLKDQNGPNWQYWECSMFVPTTAGREKWQERIAPGQVFQVEFAEAASNPILDGKYHKTKIKLDIYRVKHLAKPMWAKDKEKDNEKKQQTETVSS